MKEKLKTISARVKDGTRVELYYPSIKQAKELNPTLKDFRYVGACRKQNTVEVKRK